MKITANESAITAVIQRIASSVFLLIGPVQLIVPSLRRTRDLALRTALNEKVMASLATGQSPERRVVDVAEIKNPLLDVGNGFFCT